MLAENARLKLALSRKGILIPGFRNCKFADSGSGGILFAADCTDTLESITFSVSDVTALLEPKARLPPSDGQLGDFGLRELLRSAY